MLGSSIFSSLKLSGFTSIFTTDLQDFPSSTRHKVCDLTSSKQLEELRNWSKPDVVINCAAIVNLGICETNPGLAQEVHINATRGLASFSNLKKIIHISTDSVFDGQIGNYTEIDKTNPLNNYAKSKLDGETAASHSKTNYYILRTNIIGYNVPLKNSLFEWAFKSLSKDEAINGFDNVYFNPLFTGDLAKIIESFILEEFKSGIYHAASRELISKYDFLISIASFFGYPKSLISPISLQSNIGGVIRPLNTTLNIQKLKNTGVEIPTVEETMNNLLNDFTAKMLQ